MQRIKIELKEVLEKLDSIKLPAPDVVVAIGRGGIIPAALVARKLEKDIAVIWLRQYSDDMPPKKLYDAPKLVKPFNVDLSGRRILIVDDFSRSGKTLDAAKNILLKNGAKEVRTLAIAGQSADFILFKTDACAEFPWQR